MENRFSDYFVHDTFVQFCAAVLGPKCAHEIIIFLITKHNLRKIRL